MCRRSLPTPAPIDYAAIARDAGDLDFPGLHRAYRMASRVFAADATRAKESILAVLAEHLCSLSLLDLVDVLAWLPMQEPAVWMAISNRLDALAEQTKSLEGLKDLACDVEPLRQASPALQSAADRAVARTALRIISRSSLRELWVGAACLRTLLSQSCVDERVLSMTLHDYLQECLGCNLDRTTARDFAGLLGALGAMHFFSQSMESFLSHVFTARMTTFISAGNLADLDFIEDSVLPNLPSSRAWQEASTRILHEVACQTDRLARLGSAGCLHGEASANERRREARVQAALQGMHAIDADILKEAGQEAALMASR